MEPTSAWTSRHAVLGCYKRGLESAIPPSKQKLSKAMRPFQLISSAGECSAGNQIRQTMSSR